MSKPRGPYRVDPLGYKKANEALDKMAENARELGLDYEPEQLKPADGQLIWVALAFIAFMLTLLTIRSCV